ncbi:MAG: beta-glucosidase BglX [Verrucomicrobiales bacterium]|nr:beta-glucosidase BglX [Verrucomicrobiales bacterium]
MKSTAIAFGLFFCLAASAADSPAIYHDGWIDLDKNGKKDIYEDPSRPVAKRVDDLLKRMTFDEKAGQLWEQQMEKDSDVKYADKLKRGEVSSFLDGSVLIETPVMRNKIQRIAVEQSRLGIPLIFANDVIHGFRTIFPIPLAQACAWEPELFEKTQTIAAREAAAAGIDWAFSPMVDLARDARWGRIAEGFGEDPWLGALDSAASVRGFQGANVADTNRVVACLKHYVGYGAAEGGRDYNTTEISEYTLRNFYLPQFKAGVDAGAWTVMSAFNELSGMPASGNHHTLTEILRGEWKFPGFVVSDWTSVSELIAHGVAADDAEAARLALTAGVDMEMVSRTYLNTLARQVKAGKISESAVDEAVRRVLTVKFEKGLFDQPFTDESRCQTAFLRPDALALARAAAAESCVLLKNGNGALPVSRSVKKIALIGPLADDPGEMIGCWVSRGHAEDAVSLAAGIRAKLAPDAELTVVRGCDLTGTAKIQKRLDGTTVAATDDEKTRADDIAKAVAAANAAEVVMLALGEPAGWSGENSSRSDLGLPGRQQELFNAVAATGKPVIVVLFNGRPLALPVVQEKAAAILEAWFPGVQGGHGVADVLFGEVDPGGRLTTTFPRNVGQVPIYYNHYNTGRPGLGKYLDGPSTPLYPFGFGLAYTTFEYGKVQLSAPEMKLGGTITASVKIKNTGTRAGTEVAQLYLRDVAASAGPRPVRELKGFQKILLQPGESRDVTFTISEKDLGYYDAKGNWLVEPGKFQLWISKDSASGDTAKFELAK